MLRRIFKKKESVYDELIRVVLEKMKSYGPDNDEYPLLRNELEQLTRLKADEGRRLRVSPDTFAIVLGNLLGILIIVAYEQKHVVTSRGLGFVLKARNQHISS